MNTTASTNILRADGSIPPRFTGRQGNQYYYRGRIWSGPSNAVGQRLAARIRWGERARTKCVSKSSTPYSPWGMSIVALTDGPFVVIPATSSSPSTIQHRGASID